jgi:hypothetical protein
VIPAKSILELFERTNIVPSGFTGGDRKDGVDPAPEHVVKFALIGNPGALPDGKFRADCIFDTIQAIGTQYACIQQLLAKLDQSDCGRMSAQADEVQRPVTLAYSGIPSGDIHQHSPLFLRAASISEP